MRTAPKTSETQECPSSSEPSVSDAMAGCLCFVGMETSSATRPPDPLTGGRLLGPCSKYDRQVLGPLRVPIVQYRFSPLEGGIVPAAATAGVQPAAVGFCAAFLAAPTKDAGWQQSAVAAGNDPLLEHLLAHR